MEQEQQNNGQLIDRLLGEQKAPDAKERLATSDESQVLITTSRVVGIRYRVYFLIALVLVIVFGNYILLPAWDLFQTTRAQLQTITLEVDGFATKKLQMDADKELIAKMEQQQNIIVSCLNDRTSCKEIDQSIKNSF
jgi:Na+-transporting NADH:ubiquinone oxidoreductase subunit NqrF